MSNPHFAETHLGLDTLRLALRTPFPDVCAACSTDASAR